MRVLLVDPPCHRFMNFHRHYFPLGLAHLAAELHHAGHDVLVYDAEHDSSASSCSVLEADSSYHLYLDALKSPGHTLWSEFTSVVETFRPEVVGFSTLSVKVAAVLYMSKLVKQRDAGIVTIAGGDHATARPQDLVKNKAVDLAVRGEGEKTIVELISCIARGGNPALVAGVSWAENGHIASSPPAQPIEDLDQLQLPYFDALHANGSYRPVDMGLMVTERGCPYSCTFCGLATIGGRALRFHSVRRILAEIRLRHAKYGTQYFSFRNGTFTLLRSRVVELCRELKALEFQIQWECLTRSDHLDASLVEMMMDAGCCAIRMGVESGSERILRSMGKKSDLEAVRRSATLLNQSGIFWAAYFMLGVPEETAATMNETLRFMQELNPPFITLAKFTPIAGTPMYEDVVRAGRLQEDETDWTWSLNQSLHGVFVKQMDPDAFSSRFREIGEFVRQHNGGDTGYGVDLRTKPRMTNIRGHFCVQPESKADGTVHAAER